MLGAPRQGSHRTSSYCGAMDTGVGSSQGGAASGMRSLLSGLGLGSEGTAHSGMQRRAAESVSLEKTMHVGQTGMEFHPGAREWCLWCNVLIDPYAVMQSLF